ncbi:MAG TPA: NADH-quinone oxidoreductase subunit N [Planctomycetaceae bacterium]|nr:NADH-quinone oxidoreductase subunit N [Planctomycetaceae bacterium]
MLQTLQLILPQTLLAGLGCLFILGGTIPVAARRWGPLALLALALGACALYYSSGIEFPVAGDHALAVSRTAPSLGFQWSALALGVVFVMMSMPAQSESKTSAEFYGMLLFVLAGLMLVSAANDLVLLFLALELISVPTYVLLYLGRNDYATQESATKYFLLSILSAAILLYGFAFLYGLTGTTQLSGIHEVLRQTYESANPGEPRIGGSVLGVLSLVLITAGLGFKIAAVPFHFYAPDVYEGTSAFNAGLLAVVPKAAGFFALIRVGAETMTGFETTGQELMLILAAITMTGGNCLALLQTNVRRLLAYSSIAHAGYMLIGIAVGFWEAWNPKLSLAQSGDATGMGLPGGINAAWLYLLAYSLTTAGLFAVLVYLGRPGKQVEHIDDLTGLWKTHPLIAVAAALFLFSLTGIPPLPGFWGKLAVFSTALSVRHAASSALFSPNSAFTVLAVLGVVNAAIGAVYYLRLVSAMFLNDPLAAREPRGGRWALAAVMSSAAMVIALGVAPRPVFQYLQGSSAGGTNLARVDHSRPPYRPMSP